MSAAASIAAGQEKPGAKTSATWRFFLQTQINQDTTTMQECRKKRLTLFRGHVRRHFVWEENLELVFFAFVAIRVVLAIWAAKERTRVLCL
jgi:hypothetical protein